jgi:hypothetical protein
MIRSMPNRWWIWAQSFLDRHRVLPERYCGIAVVLHRVSAGSCEETGRYRWTNLLWQVFPRVQLAIGSLFREMIWKSSSNAMGPVLVRGILSSNAHLVRRRGSDQAGFETPRSTGLIYEGERISPLSRLFSRTEVVDKNGAVVRRVFGTALLTEACYRVVQRVLEGCKRIEERRPHAITLREGHGVSSVIRRPLEQKETIAISPWGPSLGKPGFAMTASHAPIDMDRLTDQVMRQIDQRIVAHRERMGKVF